MSSKQQVRDWVDQHWDAEIRAALASALSRAQARQCAEELVDRLLPELPAELLEALVTENREVLVARGGVPTGLDQCLVESLVDILVDEATAKFPNNRYARSPKLAQVIRDRVAYWRNHQSGALERLTDELFERYGERMAQPEEVRREALKLLSNRALDLCLAGSSTAAAHQVKAVTLLAVPWGDRAHRASLVSRLRDPTTASAPFVIKYLNRDLQPEMRDLPDVESLSIAACTADLTALCRQIAQVSAAVDSFRNKEGILSKYIDPEQVPAPEHQDAYAAIEDYSISSPGDIAVTAKTALHSHRRVGYRVPDGAVCLVGLAGIVESVLQQVRREIGLSGGENSRPHEILRKLRVNHPNFLSAATIQDLEIVFPERDLGLRDSLAHGAFFFSDVILVERAVGILTRCVANLLTDVRATPEATRILSRASGRSMLSPASESLIRTQAQQAPLSVTLQNLATIENASNIVRLLAPDKANIWRTSLMIWGDKQRSSDPLFVHYGLTLSLLTLEEVLRALFEEDGQLTLRVTPDGNDRVKCQLAILDDQPGNLLDPALLGQVLGATATQPPFSDSTKALQETRDAVMHGRWGDIAGIEMEAHELALKWILSVVNTRAPACPHPPQVQGGS